MDETQSHLTEAQKNPGHAESHDQRPASQPEQGPEPAVPLQAADPRAVVNGHQRTATDVLALQSTVGNRTVRRILAQRTPSPATESGELTSKDVAQTQRDALTPVKSGSVARIVVQRQNPPPPAQGQAAQPPTIVFDPTFEITPGGLAPGKERTQKQFFRGDRLTFKARVTNIVEADTWFGVTGRVASSASAPTYTLSGDSVVISTTVGNMGQLKADLGQSPELVDAKPYAKLKAAPFTWIGDRIFTFKVVGDMAWLSGQCTTAGTNLQSAFMGLSSLVDQAYLNYDEAYQLHKTAVDNNGKRQQLENDLLLGILLAGIGGGVGGKIADILKPEQGAAVATAVGDVSKYMVRLVGVRTPGGTGQQGSDTPNPTVSPGTSKAAGVSPERWKAIKEKELKDAAKAGVDICAALKVKLDEAWAQGKTDMMDVDPVQVVEPTVQSLQNKVEVKTTREYSIELWRTWLRTYGITAKENWAGGKTRTDMTTGHTAFTDSKLFDDIHKQVGEALDDEVSRLRQETAPDPLTELPD